MTTRRESLKEEARAEISEVREVDLIAPRVASVALSRERGDSPKLTPSDKGSSFHIPSLDGLRGGAFLLVFLGHALPEKMLRFVPPAFGVTVFFVLSGYLITTLLRKEYDRAA